jgi:DNA-binding response OmpR family regulator
MIEDKYVLLVEDDLDINEAIQTVLETKGRIKA